MLHRPAYTPSVQELRALVYCAEFGTVTRAADALNLTQSAVSRSIRILEEKLGVRLFHRVKKRLLLSEAGRAMVRDSKEILERLENSAQMVMAFGGGGSVLRVATLPTFAATWLIPRLFSFAENNPGISIDIASALGPVDFDDSPFDAAIQRAVMARKGTKVTPILGESLITVASPNLVGSEGKLSAEVISKYPLIQLTTRPELWDEWFLHVGADKTDGLKGPRFEHFGMVISAAQAGLGIAILPDIFARPAIDAGALIQVHQSAMSGPTPYALIQPDSTEESASMNAFSNWLQNLAVGM